MEPIKLHAYYAGNLGDDLMIHILLRKYPGYMFISDGYSHTEPFQAYPNYLSKEMLFQKYGRLNHIFNILTAYCRPNFFIESILKKWDRRCKCGVIIGGSMFMESRYDTQPLSIRMEQEFNKLKTGPLFVIGANFGPVYTTAFHNAYCEFFQHCAGVSFRDKASCRMFPELKNIQYAPDVVLNLETEKNVSNPSNGRVLISVIDLTNRPEICHCKEAYESFVAELCEKCVDMGKIPVLVSFCKAQGDETAIQSVLSHLPESVKRRVETFCYTTDIQKAINLFEEAEAVIATRFHAMILGFLCHKGVFALVYDGKMRNVLEDIGSNAWCLMEDVPELSIDKVFQHLERPVDLAQYIENSKHQFDQLEGFLHNGNES